jgi:hypothetical protein
MDTHNKPYTCTYVQCSRHKRGFSRKDNLKDHLERHRKKSTRRQQGPEIGGSKRKHAKGANFGNVLLGAAMGRIGGRTKSMSKREMRTLLNMQAQFIIQLQQLFFNGGNGEESEDAEDDDDDEDQDDDGDEDESGDEE